jgi:O-methyltransferase involved in polyketide biosynthesis
VNLGCGLSQYFQWLDNGRNTWLDTDMRPSMELRRRLLPPDTERQRSAIIDLRRPQWWQDLNLPAQALGQPLFMLCEGCSCTCSRGRCAMCCTALPPRRRQVRAW